MQKGVINVFLTMLSNLLIKPMGLVLESIFFLALYFTDNIAASIILLSVITNLMTLPLYKKADNFRGLLSLLLDVLFFVVAYQFLANLQILRGVSFGPIRDLSQPDALLCFGGVTINVLPILMTLLNMVSGYIYTMGFPMKVKLQRYGIAAVFLVLLYQAPSSVVFYWTLNTLSCLIKNTVSALEKRDAFAKLKLAAAKIRISPKKFSLYSSLLGVAVFLLFAVHQVHRIRQFVLVLGVLVLLQLPAVRYFCIRKGFFEKPAESDKKQAVSYLLGCAFLAVLTGLHIPGAVIAGSPEEFARVYTLTNPLLFLLMTLMLSCGAFVIWNWIFYRLSRPGGQMVMNLAVWVFSGIAVINYLFFGKNYGNLSAHLIFDVAPVLSKSEVLINLTVILAAGILLTLIWVRKRDFIPAVYIVLILGFTVMTLVQIPKIHEASKLQMQESISQEEVPENSQSSDGENKGADMTDQASAAKSQKLPCQFFYYSLFKVSPVLVQPFIYNDGAYMDLNGIYMDEVGLNAGGISLSPGVSCRLTQRDPAYENQP